MLGDNPDALYYTAPVRADMTYRVTGNIAGCVYLSFTVELGSADGGYSTQTAGVLRDADFDVAPDGSFEVFFGGPERARPTGSRCRRARPSSSCVATSRKPSRRPRTRTGASR